NRRMRPPRIPGCRTTPGCCTTSSRRTDSIAAPTRQQEKPSRRTDGYEARGGEGPLPTIGNLICLTPRDSYVVDGPVRRRGVLGRLEGRIGPFVRSPGIGFPYLVGYFRKHGVLSDATRVVVQHDKIEGATPFTEILGD